MILKKFNKYFNRYYGRKWINVRLPTKPQIWMLGPYELSVKKDNELTYATICEIKAHLEKDSWIWPKRTVYFFSDMHADADAFIASLVASGGVE
ncbi:MAG: hypothetical protein KAI17_22050, partial [Thiotrichaceae bacterium]|nr:hypothetical protein [Thiotrichaceae bacterium]